MDQDAITLSLDGQVQLQDLSKALAAFHDLISNLQGEISPEADIAWVIEDLSAGSATATVRGECVLAEAVVSIVDAVGGIGVALEQGHPILYGPSIRDSAKSLASILDGHIQAIRIETANSESVIVARYTQPNRSQVQFSQGAIKGTVETLTGRRGAKFIIYDSLFDRSVICHYRPEHEPLLRQAYRRRVIVSGRIKRAVETGRALSISDISRIDILPEPADFRIARGILPLKVGAESSEDAVRRLRDA